MPLSDWYKPSDCNVNAESIILFAEIDNEGASVQVTRATFDIRRRKCSAENIFPETDVGRMDHLRGCARMNAF